MVGAVITAVGAGESSLSSTIVVLAGTGGLDDSFDEGSS